MLQFTAHGDVLELAVDARRIIDRLFLVLDRLQTLQGVRLLLCLPYGLQVRPGFCELFGGVRS
jgi:hypothetical protein